MKRIRTVLATIGIATLAFIPTDALAAENKGIESITTVKNNGTAIHIEGSAKSETLAVAISVYNEDGSTLIGSPESTSTVGGIFNYDVTGTFDISKSYKVCAADFDEGSAQVCENTDKAISSIEVTVKPPKIGDTVTLINHGSWNEPDKEAVVSVKDDLGTPVMAWFIDKDTGDPIATTFEANKDYYVMVDITPKTGYIFTGNLAITLKGGGVKTESGVFSGGSGAYLIVKIKPTIDGEEAKTPDTGIAPKASDNIETEGIATRNISLGVSIIVASAITYGAYLIISRKATRK